MADFRDEYIDIYLNGNKRQIIRGIYQYDHGLKLRIHGQPTTSMWQMQYGCVGNRETVTVFSTLEDGTVVATVPDTLLMQPRDLMCYIYLEEDSSGVTVYEILMPIIRRIKPTSGTYTPEQIDNFNTLLEQFNALIDEVETMNDDSETINSQLQTELERLSTSNFYVDPEDGNLYVGS